MRSIRLDADVTRSADLREDSLISRGCRNVMKAKMVYLLTGSATIRSAQCRHSLSFPGLLLALLCSDSWRSTSATQGFGRESVVEALHALAADENLGKTRHFLPA